MTKLALSTLGFEPTGARYSRMLARWGHHIDIHVWQQEFERLAAAREVRRDTVGGEAIAPLLVARNDDGAERCPPHDAGELAGHSCPQALLAPCRVVAPLDVLGLRMGVRDRMPGRRRSSFHRWRAWKQWIEATEGARE
jgi:hypothetical protein